MSNAASDTVDVPERKPIPVTVFTGFLGAGKTSVILGLLKQLPKDYRVVLLKNEYGDIEVDSLLAKESSIAGVSEILNGCMCCTLVGQIQTAMLEIRDKMNPDRIIIESSGSAFPATLAIQIRQLAPEGFSLDAIATVIDSVNFEGYEDSSPTAKIQAKYTDLLLLNKHELVSERALDTVIDHLYTLNEDTPVIRVSAGAPLSPSLIFGLDTKLFQRGNDESADWELVSGGKEKARHTEEVETRSVWKGGKKPGSGVDHTGHSHGPGEACTHDESEKEAERSTSPKGSDSAFTISAEQLNPSPGWRLATILAVPALIIALGIPYWYMTTSIERASLPLSSIDKLRDEPAFVLKTPIQLGRWDVQTKQVYGAASLADVRTRLAADVRDDRGWHFSDVLRDEPSGDGGLKVGITDVKGGTAAYIDTATGTMVVPWASNSDVEEETAENRALSAGALATHIKDVLNTALPAIPPTLPSRAVKYSQNITLSFVLLNEDASLGGGYSGWDIEEALQHHIYPVLDDFRDIHTFAVETQVLHHAPLRFTPKSARVITWNDAGTVERNESIHLVSTEELQFFVNSEAWTLDSASSRDPVLRFMLFVPAVDLRPLRLEGATQPTSFLIPQVGAVAIYNPIDHEGSSKRLIAGDISKSFGELSVQLAALLGILPSLIPQSGLSSSPVNPWQLESLLRSRTLENCRDASETLQSLGRIVRKAREMQIPHQVQVDILDAIEGLREARQLGPQSTSGAYSASVAAKTAADKAFFNPAMMAMLYFPDEHKYAVYMPLFAPVAVSIVIALLKELKRRRSLRRAKGVKVKTTASDASDEDASRVEPAPSPPVEGISRPALDAVLEKLPFDIYRVKGLVHLAGADELSDSELHILNWAFGRSELTPISLAEVKADMRSTTYRFTLMGAHGEVKKQARRMAETLGGAFA